MISVLPARADTASLKWLNTNPAIL